MIDPPWEPTVFLRFYYEEFQKFSVFFVYYLLGVSADPNTALRGATEP
jgi:hypothetical protein